MKEQQLLIGIGILGVVGIALYVSQTTEEVQRGVEDDYGLAQIQDRRNYEDLLDQMMHLEAEFNFTVEVIIDKLNSESAYKYFDFFEKYRPAEHKILINFRQKLIQLRGRVDLLRSRVRGTTLEDQGNWESMDDSIIQYEYALNQFYDELHNSQDFRDKQKQDAEPPQEVHYSYNTYQAFYAFDQRQQQANIDARPGNFVQANMPAQMDVDMGGNRPSNFVQGSRQNRLPQPQQQSTDNTDMDAAEASGASIPRDNQGQKRKREKEDPKAKSFDQGASTSQQYGRQSANPPPPKKGEYGTFDPSSEPMPRKIRKPEFYVRVCKVAISNILKMCRNTKPTDSVKEMLVYRYRNVSRNFYLLDQSMRENGTVATAVPGANDVLQQAKRLADEIKSLTGFDVRKGFSKPKPTSNSPLRGHKAKRHKNFDQTYSTPVKQVYKRAQERAALGLEAPARPNLKPQFQGGGLPAPEKPAARAQDVELS